MALRPVARRSVPDEVFDQIVDDVLCGELAPGESLPSERRLSEVLGVSRPAVREALQRVAQAGLVDVRHGDASTVRDFRRHAGLDLLPRLLLPRGELDAKVARSVLEVRLHAGPKIAELAAIRGGARIEPALLDCIEAMEADPDLVARQRHALAYWDNLVDGADSIAYRLMFNSLRAAYEPVMAVLAPLMSEEFSRPDAYRVLAAAVAAGDGAATERAADSLLRPATVALLSAIRNL